MPALPNVPQVLRTVIKTSDIAGASDVINRIFLQYSGTAPTDGQLNTLAATVVSAWGTNLKALYNTSVQLSEVVLEDLTSPTSAVGSASATTLGTRGSSGLGAGTAFVLQSKVARRYRGGHPRTYLQVGIDADLLTLNEWESTFVGAVVTGWDAFITEILGAPWSGGTLIGPVNVSYYEGFTPHLYPSGRYRNIPNLRTTPLIDAITTTTGNPKIGSQRRRNQQGS